MDHRQPIAIGQRLQQVDRDEHGDKRANWDSEEGPNVRVLNRNAHSNCNGRQAGTGQNRVLRGRSEQASQTIGGGEAIEHESNQPGHNRSDCQEAEEPPRPQWLFEHPTERPEEEQTDRSANAGDISEGPREQLPDEPGLIGLPRKPNRFENREIDGCCHPHDDYQ